MQFLWETREKEMMALGRPGPKQEKTIKTELKQNKGRG
jgi:hypothetical protein